MAGSVDACICILRVFVYMPVGNTHSALLVDGCGDRELQQPSGPLDFSTPNRYLCKCLYRSLHFFLYSDLTYIKIISCLVLYEAIFIA